MTPRIRKLALIAHIASSLGWFGAVAAFEALAIAGLSCSSTLMVRAAYLSMRWTTWFIIIPFALMSLLTGLVLALGTRWGLFRHYWIFVKFLINAVSIIILLFHTRLIGLVARTAAKGNLSSGDLLGLRIQLVVISGAALVALLVATALGVFKPRGLTPFAEPSNRHIPSPNS
jgi:hypothetical protein